MAGAAGARPARPAGEQFADITRRDTRSIRRPPNQRRTVRGAFDFLQTAGSTNIRPSPAGLVEVQDEGSQLIALACEPADDERIARSLRRSGRQVAGARRCRSGRVDSRHRQQSRPSVEARTPRGRGQARRSKRGCSIRRTNWRNSPTGASAPTSSSSMRHARAAERGGAIPKAAGGSRPSGSTGSSTSSSGCSTSPRSW